MIYLQSEVICYFLLIQFIGLMTGIFIGMYTPSLYSEGDEDDSILHIKGICDLGIKDITIIVSTMLVINFIVYILQSYIKFI